MKVFKPFSPSYGPRHRKTNAPYVTGADGTSYQACTIVQSIRRHGRKNLSIRNYNTGISRAWTDQVVLDNLGINGGDQELEVERRSARARLMLQLLLSAIRL